MSARDASGRSKTQTWREVEAMRRYHPEWTTQQIRRAVSVNAFNASGGFRPEADQ